MLCTHIQTTLILLYCLPFAYPIEQRCSHNVFYISFVEFAHVFTGDGVEVYDNIGQVRECIYRCLGSDLRAVIGSDVEFDVVSDVTNNFGPSIASALGLHLGSRQVLMAVYAQQGKMCSCLTRFLCTEAEQSNSIKVTVVDLVSAGLTIQRHVDPDVSFSRGWVDYEAGFGDLDGDFWIGLAEMHRLTAFCPAIIGINMTADDGESAWAQYTTFSVSDSSTDYMLQLSGHAGSVSDSLHSCNGMKFSTFDRDNDVFTGNCANGKHSGWWFSNCGGANPNGKVDYVRTGNYDKTGAYWYQFRSFDALRSIEMKLFWPRPQ